MEAADWAVVLVGHRSAPQGFRSGGKVEDKNVLDATLIAAAQAVVYYEITRYGTLIAWAEMLGRKDAAALLRQKSRRRQSHRRK